MITLQLQAASKHSNDARSTESRTGLEIRCTQNVEIVPAIEDDNVYLLAYVRGETTDKKKYTVKLIQYITVYNNMYCI